MTKSFFDRAALIERIGDDADLLAELIALFVEVQPPRLAALERAIAAADKDATRSTAHTLKGAFASMSMDELARLAFIIERSNGDQALALQTVREVRSGFDMALEELHAFAGRVTSENA